MKICVKCKESKPLTEYHASKQNKNGRHSQCKSCKNKYSIGLGKFRDNPELLIKAIAYLG